MEEFGTEYDKPKEREKRALRRYKNVKAKRRLYKKIERSTLYKPSIGFHSVWDPAKKEFIYTGRIRHGKNSKAQGILKKASKRKIRKLKDYQVTTHGNSHKKYFDYWWIWY